MSRRFDAARGGHHHLAWDSQPLVGPAQRRGYSPGWLALAFAIGLLIGLLI
ncbi:hypothetical protein [Sphingobium yanoikuyae]|uniref:Uncharacterized protein n=1 Tax=Sphingobium yanoikuyae TaxID=13690 RepID=A0A9X7UC69_SPHYA|nr:hypothetical protein [Sphingobium yanoikuyae]QNG47402.1 hypothetical protein H3V42_07270 [Sphingobium yanoikuyae]